MTNTNSLNFGHLSWKSYNLIKKKAMEQEFSWSGLLISLSIAFFIVISCAQALNLIHQSMVRKNHEQQSQYQQIYRLENNKNDKDEATYLHTEYINEEQIKYLPQIDLV